MFPIGNGQHTQDYIVFPEHYTFALMMFTTGERPSAILRLNWGDIEGDMVTFRQTKATGPRSVPIIEGLVTTLQEYADTRIRINENDPVFCHDDTGQRLPYAFFPKRFAHMMATLGLPVDDAEGRKRTPYSLKSSLITHLIDGGADPILVRDVGKELST
ncbi:tyrosine-type recombinase/integrase [Sediminispirochaeta bajacaliforniensis]|uniref:tyrosine-type recombinase/integrase n=1 Tax=Sediminispirochaeta bajacaliforniensis TaxID=148 RepID=UPI002ADDFC3D|nr:tyrosine-type recombinase/integrase [Sediminispirochaeta bajacaliforniensis]